MESRALTVLGLRIRVLEQDGGRRGDPVLLIHGVGGWAENWRAVMSPLAASGRRVFAVDLPGFGESERPGRVRYFAPDDAFYPRFITGVLDALGVARAHLGGHSMGGSIALMTSLTAPTRTRSVVLVAPVGFGRKVALYLRLCALPGMTFFARVARPRRGTHGALRSCYYDPARITPELLAEADRYGGTSFPELVRALGQGLDVRGIRASLRTGWIARASGYDGPVLVLWGQQDRLIPVTHLDEVRRLLPRAEVHVIDRCGHFAMAECPDAFLAATTPFLAHADGAAAA